MRYSKGDILNIMEKLENGKAEELDSEALDFKKCINKSKELYKTLIEYTICFTNQKLKKMPAKYVTSMAQEDTSS